MKCLSKKEFPLLEVQVERICNKASLREPCIVLSPQLESVHIINSYTENGMEIIKWLPHLQTLTWREFPSTTEQLKLVDPVVVELGNQLDYRACHTQQKYIFSIIIQVLLWFLYKVKFFSLESWSLSINCQTLLD